MCNNLLLLPLTLLMISSCAPAKEKNDVIRAIQLSWDIPFLSEETSALIRMKDSCQIYYMDDMVLYRTPYTFIQYNNNTMSGDTVFISNDEKNISFRMRKYRNFAYKTADLTGFKYDAAQVEGYTRFNVDSLLRAVAFKGAQFFCDNDSLIETIIHTKNEVFKKYVPKKKIDESFADSTYLYFTPNLKKIAYSLSKEADNLSQMKLVEVILIYNAVPKGGKTKVAIPKRRFLFKIKGFPIINREEVLTIFNRFKKDAGAN